MQETVASDRRPLPGESPVPPSESAPPSFPESFPESDALRDRLRRRAVEFGPALALFGAVKLIGFSVFMLLLDSSGRFHDLDPRFGGGAHPWDVLGSWDGWWYQQVAQFGYHPELIADHGGFFTVQQNSSAFFPLYPGLIRLVSDCTGIGLYGAGMLVSIVASFAAAAGIYAVTAQLAGARAGVIAAAVWGAFPGAGVEWAVYTESLFVALTVWSCYFVITRQWVNAALITFIAGLSRPTSMTLIAGVALSAAVALFRRRDGVLGPLSAILLPPLSFFGYIGWVGYRMGHWDGYLTLQRGAWLHFFDFGKYTSDAVSHILTGDNNYLFAYPTEDLLAVLVLFALPCLLVPLLRLRPPLVITVYTLGTLVLALGSQQMFGTLSRFVLPVFPLTIPIAIALRRLSLPSLATVLGMGAIASGWFAGYVIFELGIP
ncbi:membrane protein [Saccharothrix sp. ST-888]|nr:membrane protein [Saccharothrix sp. ST-888]